MTPPPDIQTRWTYRDLDRLPADLMRYELWEGELIMTPAPNVAHQTLVMRIVRLFVLHDPQQALGSTFTAPMDVVLGEDITVQPDVVWIARANAGIITHERIMGAPDLCVEVTSPATAYADKDRKLRYYSEAGVREYWLADPEARTLTLYAPGRNTHTVYQPGAVARSALPELEGLTVEVGALFAGLP